MAVHICKAFLQKSSPTIPPHIETLLLHYLVPVKPSRKFPRTKKRKGFVSFVYRVFLNNKMVDYLKKALIYGHTSRISN